MASKRKNDKIGTLSHSAGIISLTPSLLTIGGQQFKTGALSRTISTDVTMVANTRYQIYAIRSGGVISLKISANENSAGPTGAVSWKLVGSFYSDGSSPVLYGSFINIEGTPEVDSIWATRTQMVGTTGGSAPGNATEYNTMVWGRTGSFMNLQWRAAGTWVSNGTSGQYHLFAIPENLSMDEFKIRIDSSIDFHRAQICGNGTYLQNNATGLARHFAVSPHSAIWLKGAASQLTGLGNLRRISPDFTSLSTGFNDLNFNARVPIVGWSNTPIKDL